MQTWLDETMKQKPVDAGRIIGDSLAATNRVAVSHAKRLELAEKYYASALVLWPLLEREFARAPQPLNGDALAAAKAALNLAVELSTAYKHMLAHEADRRLLLTGNRLLVALLHRCLQCTTRILVSSYLSYAPVPARTWHDAHEIYVYSMKRGLQLTPIAGESADTTPERLYMQMLLLALANPYGFLPGQLTQVIQYIAEYGHWAKLTDAAPVHRLAKAVAIVPLGHDFPPFSANKGGNVDGGKLFLLTFDLAFQIQEQLRTLEGARAGLDGSTDPDPKALYILLLRRLLRQWAIPPARQFNRLPSRARVVMCAGLPAVWQYSKGVHAGVAKAPAGLPPMTSCQVINHTPAGYALRQTDTVQSVLRIGELIALRIEGRTNLQVAMVRWFRNTLRGSGLELGCELLSEKPEAAAARLEGAPDSAPFVYAVILPENTQDSTPAMLIVPSRSFAAEQAITLRRASQSVTAVLTKFVEQGPAYELYEFVVVS